GEDSLPRDLEDALLRCLSSETLTRQPCAGETPAMDAETRDAFERLATDLRAEIRSVDTGLRTFIGELTTDLRAEIRSGDAETRAYVDASAAETPGLRGCFRGHLRRADARLRGCLSDRLRGGNPGLR